MKWFLGYTTNPRAMGYRQCDIPRHLNLLMERISKTFSPNTPLKGSTLNGSPQFDLPINIK